jgi:hypothetical protein
MGKYNNVLKWLNINISKKYDLVQVVSNTELGYHNFKIKLLLKKRLIKNSFFIIYFKYLT